MLKIKTDCYLLIIRRCIVNALVILGGTMNKNKFHLNKMRENFAGVEKFAYTHILESLGAVALIVAALSAWTHLFVGTIGWSMLALLIGSACGIFFSSWCDSMLKRIYALSRRGNRASMVIAEGAKIAIALFLPFVYFAFWGVMAGSACQYFIHVTHSNHKNNSKAA